MLTRSILTAAVALFAAEASAFWRMDCGHLSFERVDPIDAPGKPAGHSHAVLGANNFNKLSNHTSLLDAECTTCQVVPDKSSYWVPNLYWQDDESKELTAVKTTGTTVYYFIRNNGVNPVKAFPPGFRMIGGHNKKRTSEFRKPVYDPKSVTTAGALNGASQAELQEYSLGFNCMDFTSGKNEDTMARPVIPQPCHTPQDETHKQCSSGMRAEIYMPSCWNGEDLDSDDHKSHVAYPSNVQDGYCPKSHPVRLPSLLFETWYTTEPINEKVNAGKTGKFVLSNGDTTGWGYHADFMNGWEQDLLEEALEKCTNLSGNVKDCEVFTRDGNLQPINTGTCEKKHWDFPDEDCEGPIKKLPGNNPIGDKAPADSDDESDDESDDVTESDTFATHDDDAPAGDGAGVADSVTVEGAAKTVTEVAPAQTVYARKHRRHAHRV